MSDVQTDVERLRDALIERMARLRAGELPPMVGPFAHEMVRCLACGCVRLRTKEPKAHRTACVIAAALAGLEARE